MSFLQHSEEDPIHIVMSSPYEKKLSVTKRVSITEGATIRRRFKVDSTVDVVDLCLVEIYIPTASSKMSLIKIDFQTNLTVA